jgi:hypothetical protein
MTKSWLTFSAIQAKNSSTEAKESNDIQNHNYLWYTKDKYEEKYNELDKSVSA